MSTKSSTSSSTTKRARRGNRKLTDRERLQREIEHLETQLRSSRSSRDSAGNKEERELYQKLVDNYENELKTKTGQMSEMNKSAQDRRNQDAVLSAWRNMGKAMASKTLQRQDGGDVMNGIRDAVAKAAREESGTDAEQAFLAGVGTGVRDLTKPSRKKAKKSESAEEAETNTSVRRSERLSTGEGSRDESDAEAEDSEGRMDTSQ
jgi:hypothetical protein